MTRLNIIYNNDLGKKKQVVVVVEVVILVAVSKSENEAKKNPTLFFIELRRTSALIRRRVSDTTGIRFRYINVTL